MRLKKFIIFTFFTTVLLWPAAAFGAGTCCVCNQWINEEATGDDQVQWDDRGQLIIESDICQERATFNPIDGEQETICFVKESTACVTKEPVTTNLSDIKFSEIILGVRIPNLRFSPPPTEVDENGNIYIPWVGEYVKALYNFSMVAISVVAVVMIIIQGLRISASGGGPAKSEAMKKIGQAVVGLLLAWGSYVILFAVNPDLLELRSLDIKFIEGTPMIDSIDENLTSIPDRQVNNVTDWKQFDSRWGGEKYGYLPRICDTKGADKTVRNKVTNECCTNIQAAGCGPTSLAMVLDSYGAPVTPLQTANFIGQKGNGRVCNKGTSMDVVISKLSESPWNNFAGKKVSQNQAMDLLKQNKPIIFLCSRCEGYGREKIKTYKGHYMVLTGINNDGTIAVNDPGANQTAIIYMTETQLLDNNGFWYVYKNQ